MNVGLFKKPLCFRGLDNRAPILMASESFSVLAGASVTSPLFRFYEHESLL
jgi:hypothetical protein